MCLPVLDLERRRLACGKISGFEYEIVHNDMAQRCGYLRVEPGHPWFKKEPDVSVHGGITFAKHGVACPTHGPEAEWWIGFDCGHGGDGKDLSLPLDPKSREIYEQFPSFTEGRIWTQPMVMREIRKLAQQAANAK